MRSDGKHFKDSSLSYAHNQNARDAGDSASQSDRTVTRRRALGVLAGGLVVAGVGTLVAPSAIRYLFDAHQRAEAEEWRAAIQERRAARDGMLEELLDAVRAYNRALDEDGQAGLRDAWSYQEPSFELAAYGIRDGVYGTLSVPGITYESKVRLGASEQTLGLGAAHLSQTSLPVRPVEGVSANAVIAAHRGLWYGTELTEIESLVVGDEICFVNPWETLRYSVAETRVIDPSDIDAIKIQEGRNLLTLVTCHPLYRNYQRYVVYGEYID